MHSESIYDLKQRLLDQLNWMSGKENDPNYTLKPETKFIPEIGRVHNT